MPGINRFCVMATLQAVRAYMLGLKLDEAYSWGLNRAIFYAAAKRGFRGGSERVAEQRPDVFTLGDDRAFKEVRNGKTFFTIGGKVQTAKDFENQVTSRFGGRFSKAWEDAIDLLNNYDRSTLLSQNGFYSQCYKPNRDSFVEKWSKMTDSGMEEIKKRESRPRARAKSA